MLYVDQLEYERDPLWLANQFQALTDEINRRLPSEWAEDARWLPDSVTPIPGPYRFTNAPLLREPLDCLSTESGVNKVAIMKGAQVGATVGILENAIGYFMEEVKTAPMMMVTADAELAKSRLENNIIPMLQDSDLMRLIRSSDETSRHKTGKTAKQISWMGGGFLLFLGAQNANKLRSTSIRTLLLDEIDAYPEIIGKDGDPVELAIARTKAYTLIRKILLISTPLLYGISKIAAAYEAGDQRKYQVPCPQCGEFQDLRFRGERDDGMKYGLHWEMDGDHVKTGSTVYICRHNGCVIQNSDKKTMFNSGYWEPTAEAVDEHTRSYHISSLYASSLMYPWEQIAQKWVACWDDERNVPKDHTKAQEFWNNELGLPWEIRGQKVRMEDVNSQRRPEYAKGTVPSRLAENWTGSEILLLTAAVDVHKSNLAVAVFGWTAGFRAFCVDYFRIESENTDDDLGTENLQDGAWAKLTELIENGEYKADNGTIYPISSFAIDAGDATATVYEFCSQFTGGVFPLLGRNRPNKGSAMKEFSFFETSLITDGIIVTVDLFKERLSAALRKRWERDLGTSQPENHFNFPADATDKELRELTVEVKRAEVDEKTGERKNYVWHRPRGADNELWDLSVYNWALVYVVAYVEQILEQELEEVNWPLFWQEAKEKRLYMLDE